MASAIISLKNNRNLLRKRRYRKAKTLLLSESQKSDAIFKQLSPDKLREIKLKIREDARKRASKMLIVNTILVLLLCVLIYIIIVFLDGNL